MSDWSGLFAGSVLAGMAVVSAMVLGRRLAVPAALVAVVAFGAALGALAALGDRYRTVEAIAAAIVFLLAGGATGYALAAAALPGLAVRRTVHVPAPVGSSRSRSRAVVLLACTDPERYDPRAVALLGAELARDDAIDVPLLATPLVYFAEKARYRSVDGRSPGAGLARDIRDATERLLPETRIESAWTYDRPSLARTVATLAESGIDAIALVVLGSADSAPVERALAELDSGRIDFARPSLCVGPSLWVDRDLAERLAERVVSTLEDDAVGDTGVVLVCSGQPPSAGAERSGAAEDDAYFTQRVRMLLADRGVEEHRVRVAWLEWQEPDLAESVRHLAVLGCDRIVVAPATIALPTAATALDVRHAIASARLPGNVAITVLTPWGNDEAFVAAVVRSAREALGSLRQPSGP